RVVYSVQGVHSSLGLYCLTTRVCPHYNWHPVSLGVLAHLVELQEVLVLPGRAYVQRVANSVGPQANRVLDGGVKRREGLGVGGDVGLTVDLQHQGDLARVL